MSARCIYILSTWLLLAIRITPVSGQLFIGDTHISIAQNTSLFVLKDVVYAGTLPQAFELQGTLTVNGDWQNRAINDKRIFTDASAGTVLFSGGVQTIGGFPTRFPNLTLDGTGKKQLLASIEIQEKLDLTNKELDVNGFAVTMLSANITAIDYTAGGYINTSVKNTGWLIRNQIRDLAYVFPLGNSIGSQFKPLIVTASTPGYIYGKFQYYNPGQDGYPPSQKAADINIVNNLWYHALATSADSTTIRLTVPVSSVTDGIFTTIAEWNTTQQQWQKFPSSGPVLSSDYPPNDHLFTTTAALTLSNLQILAVNVATGKVSPGPTNLIIPNVITPNGDAYNQTWVINGLPPGAYAAVTIFNRWGNKVYENKKYDNSWDGKGLNAGTYFYTATIYLINGQQQIYKGYITLMR